ncbi:YpzG family protein [Halalkalibacterium halodurans]|uniref:BH0926 protein n=1 Tax=Halalkalibacterium halodurans (strain ATCC BAA-125 / DSM 18197 / FERM 7344 / JCM 9153 / C-125) TaxID=272558 RepID=Q9KEC7_HALH5|nr:YpzG family protein [Halalkalibacterium halodurans]MDY7221424.1 YpzG family protein [Halalkalibacterium halodurans]MDY7240663.1 YpzG family protein [Halalkalibacterium halodurans]MED4082951.1 YpzG family protein [Halalkalibacterium halodurans]MED4086782.1 YpzG family protein [Halalkalibacterium halodurans]MED4106282.1 YpzG family protein [Halalkalibacterium halodurans]
MGKDRKNNPFFYRDPFHSPRANPKHAFHQVNGETQQSLHNHVLEVDTRKRT